MPKTITEACWVVNTYIDGQQKPALMVLGRSKIHLIYADANGVRSESRNLGEFGKMAELLYHGKPYPIRRFLKHIGHYTRTRGITATAKKHLQKLKAAL